MSFQAEAQGPAARDDRAFFGHPKGLVFILGADMGWAFGYFGMQVMLTLYMTQQLLKPGHVEHVLGFAAYRGLLERINGPMTPLGLASQTFGIATCLIYALPILGGLIADRWIGQRRAIIAGVLILTFAHVMLVGERTFLIALALMVVGTGLVKANLVSQIGRLYAPTDDRRTRGFGLYLIALNIGSLTTPLIAGTLGERLGWAYGFAALAVGVGLGAAFYISGIRHTPPDTPRTAGPRAARRQLSAGEGGVLAVIGLFIVVDGLFLGVYDQAFNIFPVWADTHVQRHVLGFLAPVTWFSTLDGVFTILGTALAVRIWTWQGQRGGDATDIRRITLGFVLATAAFLVLAASSALAKGAISPLWPEVLFFLLIDFSIPWVDTVVMTTVSRDSPAGLTSTMLGVYYLAGAGGNFLTGWLGGFADRMSMPAFWLIHAAIFGAIVALMLVGGRRLSRLLAARRPTVETP